MMRYVLRYIHILCMYMAKKERQSHRFVKFYPKQMMRYIFEIYSRLVILKSKGSSETLRDVLTSAYQSFRMEEKTHRTTKFHK